MISNFFLERAHSNFKVATKRQLQTGGHPLSIGKINLDCSISPDSSESVRTSPPSVFLLKVINTNPFVCLLSPFWSILEGTHCSWYVFYYVILFSVLLLSDAAKLGQPLLCCVRKLCLPNCVKKQNKQTHFLN